MDVAVELAELMAACPTCAELGHECDRCEGIGIGWDLAVAVMAWHVEAGRDAELVAGDEVAVEVVEGRR